MTDAGSRLPVRDLPGFWLQECPNRDQGLVRPMLSAEGVVVLFCDSGDCVWRQPADVPSGPSMGLDMNDWSLVQGVHLVPGATRWATWEELPEAWRVGPGWHGRVGMTAAGDRRPPGLASLVIAPILPPSEYLSRLRSVLLAALETVQDIDSTAGPLREELIPDWFADVTCGSVAVGSDGAARSGVRHYVERRAEAPWELQEWLFTFDPELRSWSWWDANVTSEGAVRLCVDSSGEPVFPCEELRWLAYACGARSVDGPTLSA